MAKEREENQMAPIIKLPTRQEIETADEAADATRPPPIWLGLIALSLPLWFGIGLGVAIGWLLFI